MSNKTSPRPKTIRCAIYTRKSTEGGLDQQYNSLDAQRDADEAYNQLAPDIQEALLNLPATKGKPEIHEKRLRPIAAMLRWEDQQEAWKQICCDFRCQSAGFEEVFQK